MDDAEPDFSIVAEDRLVAYLWARPEGVLRRGTARAGESLASLSYAEVVTFDRQREAFLVAAAAAATDLDAFLFAVKLEGLRVIPGRFVPDARFRRF